MYDSIISLATANGIWAVLFVFLFLFQLKDSKHREEKYLKTIDVLTNEMTVVYEIKSNLEDVSNKASNFIRENMNA